MSNLKQSLQIYCKNLHDGTPTPSHIIHTIHQYFLNLIGQLQRQIDVNLEDDDTPVSRHLILVDFSSVEYDPVLQYICDTNHEYGDELQEANKSADESCLVSRGAHLAPQTRIHHYPAHLQSTLFSPKSVIYPEIVSLVFIMIAQMEHVTNRYMLRQMVECFLMEVNSTVGTQPMKIFLKLYFKCDQLGESDEQKAVLTMFLKRMLCDLHSPMNASSTISLNTPSTAEWDYRLQIIILLMKRTSDDYFERILFESMSQVCEENTTQCKMSNICHLLETVLKMGKVDTDFKNMMLWFVLSLCQQEKKTEFVNDLDRLLHHVDSKTASEFCQDIVHMMKFDSMCEDPTSMKMMFTVIAVLKKHGGAGFYRETMRQTFEKLKMRRE
uniref:Uncharacterized protein n=1 Tax=Percolomonas cosmopolitus TaxID=63605 RepID=A0A7S1KS22_9EUKA